MRARIPDPFAMTRDEFLRGEPPPVPRVGYQLLYHVTRPENSASIVRDGLQTRYAVNDGERGWIWASSSPDAFYGTPHGTLIILQVPKRGTPADLDPYNGVHWDVGNSVVILRDVPPEDIVAVDPEVRTPLGTHRLSFFREREYASVYWEKCFARAPATRPNPRPPTVDRTLAGRGMPLRWWHGTRVAFDRLGNRNASGCYWLADRVTAEAYARSAWWRDGPMRLVEVDLAPQTRVADLSDLHDPVVAAFRDSVNTIRESGWGALSDAEWARTADFGMLEAYPWARPFFRAKRVDAILVWDVQGHHSAPRVQTLCLLTRARIVGERASGT